MRFDPAHRYPYFAPYERGMELVSPSIRIYTQIYIDILDVAEISSKIKVKIKRGKQDSKITTYPV